MQPENQQPHPQGFEQPPMPMGIGPEVVPSLPPINTQFERPGQRIEQAAEAGARTADIAAPAAIAQPIAPQVPMQAPMPQQPTPVATTATPLVAADEDLIEKEWVDKAKDILSKTKDDPYARTAQINDLQRDYLQKRYNKVIGASE